ncbi:unnamed protein product [Brachionus calyciflorus]|uniref:Uncharacterized protein n=1 Tax=Brachionus calyciflorus TaxID=104777 RepID=A0A813M651_9BILA|nr:unnamed protein product [Brachionus calyciflorus]
MLLIGTKTRSTKLIRACKIETVNELKNKTKVNFANQLLQFETTAMLIRELNQVDQFIWLDKKSLFNELEELTGDHLEFGKIVVEGLKIINNTKQMIRENMKNPQIQERISSMLTINRNKRKKESSDQVTDEEPDSDNGNKENVEYNATASRSGELGQLVVSEDRIRCECNTKCKRRDAHVSMIINKNALNCN